MYKIRFVIPLSGVDDTSDPIECEVSSCGVTRFDDRITVTLIPTVEVLLIVPGRIPLCPGAYGTGDM